jgi:hypothetical protein
MLIIDKNVTANSVAVTINTVSCFFVACILILFMKPYDFGTKG